MDLEQLLAHFEGVTEDHDGYLMHCPAHEDSQASLKLIVHENGKGGLVCRAGCDNNEIVKASGLKWRDFFNISGAAKVAPAEAPKLVTGAPLTKLAMYIDWTSAAYQGSGADTYAFERFGVTPSLAAELELGCDLGQGFSYASATYIAHPRLTVPMKGFDGVPRGLQGRDIGGQCPIRWASISNPEGQRWSPYGYFPGGGGRGPVIVAEGLSDPLTVAALGYDSIGIRGAALAGTQGVAEELAQGLKGRTVIAAGDNDPAGQKFNQKLADGLAPYGIEVLALRVPEELGPKSDVTRWREKRTAEFDAQFRAAVEAARPVVQKKEVTGTVVDSIEKRIGMDVISAEDGKEAKRILMEMVDRFGTTDKGLPSDTANAMALVAWTNGRIKYAEGLGFYVWNGQIWESRGNHVRPLVHKMGAALVFAGCRAESSGFTATARIDNLMKELRSVPSVQVAADAFDRNPDLLSFRNGTVNLRTGAIHPHVPEDMQTVALDLNYDPNAKCPQWEQFLIDIMPGLPDMPFYLQRLVGYGITGHTSEQCFAVLHGKGANGKSVFTDNLSKIFKPITKNTPFATFEDKASGGIPNDIAALREARLVMSSEGEAGKPMSEAILKRASGGDEMTARFMRQEFFTFTPKFLIMMATNHRPTFKGQDEGLWRRVKLVPFKRFFQPEERRDRAEMDHQFQVVEAEGIAAWAVRGAMEWYRSRLADPDVVKEGTKEYRESSNPLDGFVPGIYEITKNENDIVVGSDLFRDYGDWCKGEMFQLGDIWKRPTLFRRIEDLGATKGKNRKGVILYGIRKTEPAEEHAETPELFKQQ